MPSPIHHEFKRFKEPPPFNFQQNPYSDFPSFLSNNFQLRQQQQQPLVFNDSSNGGLNLVVGSGGVPYKPPDPVHRGGIPLQSVAFSMKSELPSSQFAESVSSNTGSGAPIFDINNNDNTTPAADMSFSSSNLPQRNNNGLFDALLQEAEAMAGGSEGVSGSWIEKLWVFLKLQPETGTSILVDNKGCIKLADFGTSKQVVEMAMSSKYIRCQVNEEYSLLDVTRSYSPDWT